MFTFAERFFSRSVNCFLGRVVHVPYGDDEHAPVVRQLDPFAEHADGLIARVEVDVDITPFFV